VRGFDRDLRRANGIMAAARGRAASQVEHMAAPTRAVQKLQKILANDGPSTHGLHLPNRIITEPGKFEGGKNGGQELEGHDLLFPAQDSAFHAQEQTGGHNKKAKQTRGVDGGFRCAE